MYYTLHSEPNVNKQNTILKRNVSVRILLLEMYFTYIFIRLLYTCKIYANKLIKTEFNITKMLATQNYLFD